MKVIISESQYFGLFKEEDSSTGTTEFSQENSNNIDMTKIEKSISLNDLIIGLGKETYFNLLNSDKSKLYNAILEKNEEIRIGKPSDEWFENNIRNLNIIKDNFPSSKWVNWSDGPSMPFDSKIYQLIGKCQSKDIIGILEGGDWSPLNKLDTHYTNWRDMMDKRMKDKFKIEGETQEEIVRNYFLQRDLKKVLTSKNFSQLQEINSLLGTEVQTMSYAEIDLLQAFAEKEKTKINSIKDKIFTTTERGNSSEEKFLGLIRHFNIEYVDFSFPGSLVDTILGIDCIVKLNGTWYAVQVKSSEQNARKAKINSLGINSISIYENWKGEELWCYFSPNKKEGINYLRRDFNIRLEN